MKAWALLTLVRADPDRRNLSEICAPAWVLADRLAKAGAVPETFCTGRNIVGHVVRGGRSKTRRIMNAPLSKMDDAGSATYGMYCG
jgi:hypothetical protein